MKLAALTLALASPALAQTWTCHDTSCGNFVYAFTACVQVPALAAQSPPAPPPCLADYVDDIALAVSRFNACCDAQCEPILGGFCDYPPEWSCVEGLVVECHQEYYRDIIRAWNDYCRCMGWGGVKMGRIGGGMFHMAGR